MIAVFEEISGQHAIFLVEESSKTYHLHVSKLPKDAHPGDLFEVTINAQNEMELGRELREERNRRKENNRMKRETLKSRENPLDK